MKNFVRKIMALGLISSMLMTFFTSCSTSGSREKIDSDTPWYEVNKITIGDDVDKSSFDYYYSDFICATEDTLFFNASGSYKFPEDFDWETDNYLDYTYNAIDVYDFAGNQIDSIDVMQAYRDADLGDNTNIDSISKVGDEIYIDVSSYSDDWSVRTLYRAKLGLQTRELSSFEVVEDDEDTLQIVNEESGSYERSFIVGDYTIKTFWLSVSGDTNASYIFLLTDSDGNSTKLDMREVFPGVEMFDIPTIIDMNDGTGLIICSGSGETSYYTIDTNNMSVVKDDDDMSWLENYYYNISYVEGCGSVIVNEDGINRIDFENKTLEPIFDFNNTNANRYDLNGLTPVLITEDKVVLSGYSYAPSFDYSSSDTCIYIFNRADNNPNSGKMILRIAGLSDFNYSICDAICRYNDSSEDYFIQIDTRYSITKFYDYSDDSDTSYEERVEQASLSLGNQLSIDLISGDGPDIIIDGAAYSQLNNEDYLLDLSEYVSGLDSDKYFTNIMDAARTGDSLYQLPITFAIQGITTNASNVDDGQIGFTYDQYVEFVDEICNGDDPIGYYGQVDMFIKGLELMPDLMMENGRVNYDNEAFTALAEYVRDHVNDTIDVDDNFEYATTYDDSYGSSDASYEYIVDMRTYINSIADSTTSKVLLGLPTFDGRGPVVSSYNSVAVASALSNDEEKACLEFVSLLIGDDTQHMLGIEAGIPINCNSFMSVGEGFVDQHNRQLTEWYEGWTETDFIQNGVNPNPIEYSSIEDFETLILAASSWVTSDGAVNAIIREEIPAYFEGDKTLDQVVEVLQNRVQTLLDERG